MNTSAQPLDHRAFLQQYVLAMAAGREYGTPGIRVEEAHEAWQAIEKAVAEEAQRRLPEDIAEALRSATPAPPEGQECRVGQLRRGDFDAAKALLDRSDVSLCRHPRTWRADQDRAEICHDCGAVLTDLDRRG